MINNKGIKVRQRKEIKERLKNLINSHGKSEKIFNKLISLECFEKAKSIFCYFSKEGEVETKQIIKYCFDNNKILSLPYVMGADMLALEFNKDDKLVKNKFSILEPEYSPNKIIKTIDICIVPLVGFEGTNRLGHGGGYYDKFMKAQPNVIKIGLAFNEQKISGLCVEKHDIPLDIIITDKEINYK